MALVRRVLKASLVVRFSFAGRTGLGAAVDPASLNDPRAPVHGAHGSMANPAV